MARAVKSPKNSDRAYVNKVGWPDGPYQSGCGPLEMSKAVLDGSEYGPKPGGASFRNKSSNLNNRRVIVLIGNDYSSSVANNTL